MKKNGTYETYTFDTHINKHTHYGYFKGLVGRLEVLLKH